MTALASDGGRSRLRRVAAGLMVLAFLLSGLALAPRLAYDRALGGRVAVAVSLDQAVRVADRAGLSVGELLGRLARVGLTSVVATPEQLDSVEVARGPVFGPGCTGGAAELEWLPVLAAPPGQSPEAVAALFASVASRRQGGLEVTLLLVGDPGVPGHPDDFETAARELERHGFALGLVEDPGQLGFVPVPGSLELASLLGGRVLRVYHQAPFSVDDPLSAVRKVAESVKERSLRCVWLELMEDTFLTPAPWRYAPPGESAVVAANLAFFEAVREALGGAGFDVAPAGRVSLPGVFGPGPLLGTGVALGAVGATLLAADLLLGGRRLWRRLAWPATVGAVGAGGAALCLLLWLEPVRGTQVAAFGAALAYPTLAGVWVGAAWSRAVGGPGPGLPPGAWVTVPALAGLFSAVGGLVVAGLMSSTLFATEVVYFRGVKVSLLVPPLLTLLAVWVLGRRAAASDQGTETRQTGGEVGTSPESTGDGARGRRADRAASILGTPLTLGQVAAGLLTVGALVLYVGRSANQTWLPVSDFELSLRAWLDAALLARPRLKEFLLGYPALALGSYLARTGRRRYLPVLPVLAAAGAVGLASVVNSFEHVRTPLSLTLLRTANGLWMGLLVGSAAVLAARGMLAGGAARRTGRLKTEPGADRTGGDRQTVLGVPFDRLTLGQAADRVLDFVREGPGGGRTRLVFTPNPEIVTRALRDPSFLEVLREADLSVADGVGVVWASRLLGAPVPERVSGYDLLVEVLARAREVRTEERALRVFLLGARPGVAREAAARLEAAFPGVAVAGEHHGYFTDDRPVVEAVRRAAPDLLCVGLGSPKQETWLVRHRDALGAAVALAVGGALDVLSGRTRRAPAWVRSLGMEWLYRIMSQPRARLRRAPALAAFALRVLVEVLVKRRRPAEGRR